MSSYWKVLRQAGLVNCFSWYTHFPQNIPNGRTNFPRKKLSRSVSL
jgi:hypothetical protein